MVFLGFGKYARADRIYALEPITGEGARERPPHAGLGGGIAEPIVASRTQRRSWTRWERTRSGTPAARRPAGAGHPRLFAPEE